MDKLYEKLSNFVTSGDLKYFDIIKNETEDGMCESETMYLIFPSGNRIKFSTTCSGVLENSSFILEE